MLTVLEALAPWVSAENGARAEVRQVAGRALLFVPGVAEVFGVEMGAVRGEGAAVERAVRDAARLADAGWFTRGRARASTPAIQLVLTTSCNLACDYCSVSGGTYGRAAARMDLDTARAAIERLAPTGGPLDVFFFGGEPLLAWSVLVEITRWLRVHRPGARLHVVTNGTLIDDAKAAFLAEHAVHVTVSLDGDAEMHDRHRVDHAGRGSFDRVARGIDALVRAGVTPLLRGTHADEATPLARRVDAVRAVGRRRLPVIVEGLDGRGAGDAYERETRASFELAAQAGTEVPEPLVGFVGAVLRGAHGTDLACTAGRDVAVLPDRSIHPCHIAADRGVAPMGTVTEVDAGRWRDVAERYAAPAPVCDLCWANGLCGRGCPMERARQGQPSAYTCAWSIDRLEHAAFFADVLPTDTLLEVAMRSAPASDRTAIACGILARDAMRARSTALWPVSFPGAARRRGA